MPALNRRLTNNEYFGLVNNRELRKARASCSSPSASSALLDAVKEPIAKVIARHTPLSAGQVMYVIEYAGSIDLALAAIDYGCVQNIDPAAAVRAIRAQNAGGESQ